MAAPAKKSAPTVTMKHLAANLAENHEMSKKQTEAVLGDLVSLVTKHLKKGDRIRIGGLGILQVRKRAAREGRNPATGETIHIKASKKVAFRAAKELKEELTGYFNPPGPVQRSGNITALIRPPLRRVSRGPGLPLIQQQLQLYAASIDASTRRRSGSANGKFGEEKRVITD